MGNALVAGLVGAARRWRIALLLWAISATFGGVFSLIAGHWLDLALDRSLVSRSLLKDLNASFLIDMWVYNRDSLNMLLVVAVVLIVAYVSLGIWLSGGVASAAPATAANMRLATFWRRGLTRYPVFARLWLIATGCEAAALGTAGLVGWWLTRWFAESSAEMPYYYSLGAVALVGALMLVVLIAIHDHARLYVVRRGVGALAAYRWACWFVLRGEGRAIPLALTLLAIGGLAWLVYQTTAMLLPTTSSVNVTLSILWGQVLLQARVYLRIAGFVSEYELQAEMIE